MIAKKIFIIVGLVTMMIAGYSQSSIEWEKRYGGNAMEIAKCFCPLPDGGFLLAGSSASICSGAKSECLRGMLDYWVVRVDENGNKLWDRTFGGSTFDELTTLTQTTDGGFLLGGHSTSYADGDKSEHSRGEFDYWIVKITENGKKEWDRTFGGQGHDYLLTVQKTSDGGFILGGCSSSSASGDKSDPCTGKNDFWLVKINAYGRKIWDKTFGGTAEDRLTTIKQTADGGYILGGVSCSGKSLVKSENGRGKLDFWLVKLNEKGSKEWDKTIGGNSDDVLKCITETHDGNFMIGGCTCSAPSADKKSKAMGSYDYWVVCLSPTGEIVWERTYGEDTDDKLLSIQSSGDGGYVLTGNSSIINWERNKCITVNRIIKIDTDGNELWEEIVVPDKKGYLSSSGIVCTSDSCLMVFGHSLNQTAESDEALSASTTDYYLMKFSQKHPWYRKEYITNKADSAKEQQAQKKSDND